MVKFILIKSPDEWATTKQACRDELVVYLFFSPIYIYIYMMRTMYIYIYTPVFRNVFIQKYIYIGAYFCLAERTQACMTNLLLLNVRKVSS